MSRDFIELCSKISKFTPCEIELRFLIDSRRPTDLTVKTYGPSDVKQIVEKLLSKYKKNKQYIEQTINFIAKDKIKQLVFINGEQDKNAMTHYTKNSLIKSTYLTSDFYPAYKFSISKETPIEPFEVKLAELARIKLRYSIEIDIWRLDITLIKQINSLANMAELVSFRQKILIKINVKDFLTEAPWQYIDHVEFELECIKQKDFTLESLKLADVIFEDVVNTKPFNSNSYQEKIHAVAKWIKPHMEKQFAHNLGMKSLGNQVIELDKNKYLKEVTNIVDYYITDKVDGKRAIVYVDDKIYVITDTIAVYDRKDNSDEVFIIDAELYTSEAEFPLLYVFDVMVYESNSLINEPFHKRLEYFDDVAKRFQLKLKPFIKLTNNYRKEIRDFKQKQKSAEYETDGIILTPHDGTYNNMKVYKYKPIDKLSIDFLIKKCPERLLGTYIPKHEGFNTYLLFCGIAKNAFLKLKMRLVKHYEMLFQSIDPNNVPQYFPIQFEPSDNTKAFVYYDSSDIDLDNQVGEFVRTTESINAGIAKPTIVDVPNHFTLMRLRTDRLIEVQRGNYFGNNYRIAENTWFSYYDPLVIEDIDEKSAGYFAVHDNPLQKASRSFNSYVKAQTLKNYKDINVICDLASGKGQDLFRYAMNGIQKLYGAEIDPVAVSEFIQRKHEFSSERQKGSMSINICLADLINDANTNFKKFVNMGMPSDGFKLAICNFAFHYFLGSVGSLRNVLSLLDKIIAPGGRFIFTAFDGAKIVKLLNANAGNWTNKVGNEIQYSIKSENKVTLLAELGQKIDVWLPFSLNYYGEYLVNLEYLSLEFSKKGFQLEINESFSEYLDAFAKDNPRVSAELTVEDKKYVSLYHTYVFYKKKKTN